MRQRIVLAYLLPLWQEVVVPLVVAYIAYITAAAFMAPVTQFDHSLIGIPGLCVLAIGYLLVPTEPSLSRLAFECSAFYVLWTIAYVGIISCYEQRNCVPA